MDTLLQDLRYAVRGLVRLRGGALVAIATLALGIGATTTIFSVVNGVLLRPLPFPDPDRLVILFNTQVTPRDGLSRLRWSRPHIEELQASAQSFAQIASFTSTLVATSGYGDPEHLEGEVVSPAYFAALRVTPIAGRTFTAEEDTVNAAPVAILSARLWRRRFAADPAMVGKTVTINDVALTVAGILPDGFAGLSGKAEIWIAPPMAARLTYADYLTTPQHFISVRRVEDGIRLEQANAELATIGSRFADEISPPGTVERGRALTLGDTPRGCGTSIRARAARRRGVRAGHRLRHTSPACCCSRGRGCAPRDGRAARDRIQPSPTGPTTADQGMVMAVVAGVCGTILAAWGVDAFGRLAPEVIPSGRNNYSAISVFGRPALDPGVLLFALATTLGTTVVFALVPALRSSRPELATALKEHERGSAATAALSTLVVQRSRGRVPAADGVGTADRGFARIQNRRTGFVSGNVLTFWVRPAGSRIPAGVGTGDRPIACCARAGSCPA